MRIISGKHRSRVIKMVDVDTTRETTDKVRGAIFNLLSFYPIQGVCLDLFSGSGAMGLEALSRGCEKAYFNDLGRKAYNVTKENCKALGYNNDACITNLDYRQALKLYKEPFDFIFLDPPYKLDCCNEIISFVGENQLLKDNGVIVCEVDIETIINDNEYYEIYKKKDYGIRSVYILRMK
jgi:16S rRNA (guanine966-N2)-methyltransferase